VLAARLKDLESCGVIAKRRLPPPTPAQVYELTPYGVALRPVMRELARWGLNSLPAPERRRRAGSGLAPGRARHLLRAGRTEGSFEFRIGDEVAALVDGRAAPGPAEDPDAVLETSPAGFYWLFVERRWDGVEVEGDRAALERLLDAAAAAGRAGSGLATMSFRARGRPTGQ
jgi:hypothetical protein